MSVSDSSVDCPLCILRYTLALRLSLSPGPSGAGGGAHGLLDLAFGSPIVCIPWCVIRRFNYFPRTLLDLTGPFLYLAGLLPYYLLYNRQSHVSVAEPAIIL